MALPDYAATRKEKLWVSDNAVAFERTVPKPTDSIVLIPGTTLPPVLTEYTPSEERRPTPDISDLIQRKKRVGAWTLPLYAKFGTRQGRPPSWSLLLEKACGRVSVQLTVVSFSGLTGDTVTVVVDGTSTILTEGVEFNAITSNAVTATNLAAAIHAVLGVTATANGAVVTVLRDAGVSSFAVFKTVDEQATLTAKVVWSLLEDIEESTFTITHWTGNMVRYLTGCLTNEVSLELQGSAEGKITFGGFASNEIFAGPVALSGSHNDSVTTFTLAAGKARAIQVGPDATHSVVMRVAGHAELILVTASRYATTGNPQTDYTIAAGAAVPAAADQLTVVRGFNTTTPESYTNGEILEPWIPTADTDPLDQIAGVAQGSLAIGGLSPIRGISITVVLNNALEPRLDEYGIGVNTGFRRTGPRTVGGRISGYSRQQIQVLRTNLERALPEAMTVTAGVTPAKLTATVPIMRFSTLNDNSGGPEFVEEIDYQGLASATGNDGVTYEAA